MIKSIEKLYFFLIFLITTITFSQTKDSIEKATTAIDQNDFIAVSQLIHKIKPSIESLGINSIMKELNLLEKLTKETNDKEQISILFNNIKKVLEIAMKQLEENEMKE